MTRYLVLLSLALLVLVGLSLAWSQDVPPAAKETPRKKAQPQSPAGLSADLENKIGPPKEKTKPTLRKLPTFKLKGLLKLEGKNYVGLLEVDGKEVHRVREGDEIPLTLPGKYVAEPPPKARTPPGLPVSKSEGPSPSRGNKKGVQVHAPARVTPEEYQVSFRIVKIDRRGIEVELLPRQERIMVR